MPLIEVAFVSVLLATSSASVEHLLVYLAVPAIVAGLRHGWVATTNTTLMAAVTIGAVAASMPETGEDVIGNGLFWLGLGLGIGLLASWQTRSLRTLEAAQAPLVRANRLLDQLQAVATGGRVGLDSAGAAETLVSSTQRHTNAGRAALFVRDRDDTLALIFGSGDTTGLEDFAEPVRLGVRVWPDGAAVPVVLGHTTVAVLVLADITQVTKDGIDQVRSLADEHALWLDTALKFDDVRLLASSEERNRIAREMHDGVAQEIVALGYIVDELESASELSEAHAVARSLRDEISRIVTELRFSIFDLRHQIVDHRLSGALTEYLREASLGSDLRVHLLLDQSGPALASRIEMELLRVAQEAIGNVRRHARASNLWVTLVSDGVRIQLKIEDDGVGSAQPRERHWGLQTMRERAAAIGAELTVAGRPGRGTVVTLETHPPPRHEGNRSYEHHSPAR